MTTIPTPDDPTASYTATYDAWNRLVKLEDDTNTITKYQYDGTRRRIIHKVYNTGVLDHTKHLYYNKNWQLLEERRDANTSPKKQYTWGNRYIDDLILRDHDTNNDGTLNERLYALQDANWNVTSYINSSGTVQERYIYNAYGSATFLDSNFSVISSSVVEPDHLYAGYNFDADVEVYHVRNRVYHPNLGCWLQRDPEGYINGLNYLEYSQNDPVGNADPSGLDCCDKCDKLGALKVGSVRLADLGTFPASRISPNSSEAASSIAAGVKAISAIATTRLPGGKVGGKGKKIYGAAITAALDAAKKMTKALKRYGVKIYVKISGKCCRKKTCWPYFWSSYKDWETEETDWIECTDKWGIGRDALEGFHINDHAGLTEGLRICVTKQKTKFSCK